MLNTSLMQTRMIKGTRNIVINKFINKTKIYYIMLYFLGLYPNSYNT